MSTTISFLSFAEFPNVSFRSFVCGVLAFRQRRRFRLKYCNWVCDHAYTRGLWEAGDKPCFQRKQPQNRAISTLPIPALTLILLTR